MLIETGRKPGPEGKTPARPWAESLLLLAAGAALALSLLFPIWRITLEAPQYPEGLGMYIWASDIRGLNPHDLETINQLNHYIGMKKIIPESIPELGFIRPLILAFAGACLLAAWRPRIWSSGLLLAALTLAGAAGLVDFWLWEYDYGHDLDPTAAIKVPGMSYQPPLIGEAHLLNFISTSWPAWGGILLFAAGLAIAAALFLAISRRAGWRPFASSARYASASALLCLLFTGCERQGPVPFHWGEDACHFCKMTLVEKGFAAQRINSKGKVYKYDAIECALEDARERPLKAGEQVFVSDRSRPESGLAEAPSAHYLKGGSISSPMGSALAAFGTRDSALAYQARLGGDLTEWERLRIH